MTNVFLRIVNMSISASWLVLAVLILRFFLKKAPKWVSVVLWGIVAIRLICPFSIESGLSLIPSSETIRPEIMTDHYPQISTGINELNDIVNPIISDSFAPDPAASANPLQILIPAASIIWLAGIAVLLTYTAVTYWHLRKKVATAVILEDNIFQSAYIPSPFVLGILKPRIYLPYNLGQEEMGHVIAHERSHIRRRDHWWKPLGFALLTLHWFNPLMWVAYILLCRDIELACDEKVIRDLSCEERANYTQALVSCSVGRRTAACPLAFGEVGVKERVRSVMNYKKPTFWIILAAVVACVTLAVCFLTDPRTSNSNAGVICYYGTVTDQGMGTGDEAGRAYITLHCDDGEDLHFWLPENNTGEQDLLGKHLMVQGWTGESGLFETGKVTITDHTWTSNLDEAIQNAILDYNRSARYEGLFQCADFVVLANEDGAYPKTNWSNTEIYYGIALHQVFSIEDGELVEEGASHIPTVLTFSIDESGRYILKEYWEPRDGSYYTRDIKEKFPAFIWPDTQKYIAEQKQRNSAKASEYFGLTVETAEGYVHEGVTYRYKLELTGTFPNSDAETTFVVLTNREDLTFDMVARSMYSSNSEDTKIAGEYVLLTQPDNWGITLSAKNVTPTGLTLVCKQSGGQVSFDVRLGTAMVSAELLTGSYFWIEKLTEGKWVAFPVPDAVVWTSVAYVIPWGDSTRWQVGWEHIYGALEPGQYRIGKSVTLSYTPGDSTSQSYYAEFVIE